MVAWLVNTCPVTKAIIILTKFYTETLLFHLSVYLGVFIYTYIYIHIVYIIYLYTKTIVNNSHRLVGV